MPQEEARADVPAPEPKKSNLAKLMILGIVVAVIGVECTFAFFILSSAGNATEHATESPAAGAEGKGEGKEAKHEGKEAKQEGKGEDKKGESELDPDADPAEQVEVVLGEFSVTAYQPATNTTLRIEFNLYGTVGVKEQKEFMTALEENQHRFREQVIVIVRSAEITDLTDAGLGLIKRKIMEKTNRMIGKPYLRSVIFSDFSFIEQ